MADRQDDADYGVECRHPEDRQHVKLTYVIHFYFNQLKSAETLTSLLDTYTQYARDLLATIEFIVIDDGSPVDVDLSRYDLNLRHAKILDDIPWNQGGARNLGATLGSGPWLLLSDIDICFPEKTLRYLVTREIIEYRFFKFWRWDSTLEKFRKPHSNVFFMPRGTFFKYWGYDEEYAGGHGGEDYRFVKFLKSQGVVQLKLPKQYYAFNRSEIDRKQAYHNLERDQSRNAPIDARKRCEMKYLGGTFGHSRLFLNFKWKIMSTSVLRATQPPIMNTAWKRMWLFRQVRSLLFRR